jgi:hypothetical protein
MKSLRRFFARLAGLATRRAQDERLREEIEEHIALQTAENIRAGLSPVEARRQAMLKFGGVEAVRFAVERLMNSMVFDSGSVDVVAYLIVVPSLLLATMLAVYVPARRAAKIVPTQALRYE